MNQYVVKSESGKLFGPFKNAGAAAKWANKNWLGTSFFTRTNWTIVRLFKAKK